MDLSNLLQSASASTTDLRTSNKQFFFFSPSQLTQPIDATSTYDVFGIPRPHSRNDSLAFCLSFWKGPHGCSFLLLQCCIMEIKSKQRCYIHSLWCKLVAGVSLPGVCWITLVILDFHECKFRKFITIIYYYYCVLPGLQLDFALSNSRHLWDFTVKNFWTVMSF